MLYGGIASLLLLFLFQIFAYSIQQLTINFQYFSLVEEKESPELLRRVNAMRNTVDSEPESKFSFATEKENQPTEVNPFSDAAKEDNKYDDFERFKPK